MRSAYNRIRRKEGRRERGEACVVFCAIFEQHELIAGFDRDWKGKRRSCGIFEGVGVGVTSSEVLEV